MGLTKTSTGTNILENTLTSKTNADFTIALARKS